MIFSVNMKKYFLYAFSFVFVLLGGSFSSNAFFEDIAGIPAEEAILELTESSVISTQNADGSPRTEYRPDDPINRAEFLKFAFEAFNKGALVQEADTVFQKDIFSDTNPDAWYFPYIVYSKINGIAQGYPNGEFRPAQTVTQAEALKLLMLISDIETTPDGVVFYPGIPTTAWYLEYVDQAESRCILMNEDIFLANEPLTRAEMAILTDRVRTVFFGENLCEQRRGVTPDEEENSESPEEISDEQEEIIDDEANEEEEIEEDSEGEDDAEEESVHEESEDDEFVMEDDIPEGWSRYEREIFDYSFALPELWFWNEDNGEGEVIAYVEASEEEEITEENRLLLLEIVEGGEVSSEKQIDDGMIIISLPRNDESFFRISGSLADSETIETVADSILLLSDEASEEMEDKEENDSADELGVEEGVSLEDSLLITIADDNPTAGSIPLNAKNVPMLKVALRAPQNESVEILQMTFTRKGLGNREEIERIKIFDDYEPKGNSRSFSSDHTATINLVSDPITLEAGAEKTITVAADFDAETPGGQHFISLDSLDDIIAVGSESKENLPVMWSSPIVGNEMGTSNITVGNITLEFDSPSSSIKVGSEAELLSDLTIAEQDSIEDVLVHALTLTFSDIDDGDLKNLFLDFRGDVVSNMVEQTKDGRATFVFTGEYEDGLPINQSRQKTISIRGDVMGGVGESFSIFIDDLGTDVIATGKDSGFQ